ncbi:MAG: glycosyltransferase family 1 protein, partial [Flavobacterium sp.]
MKVLWFANTPGNADEHYNAALKGSGGWIKALDQQLQEKVSLHVAFYHNIKEKFVYKKATYYSIAREDGFISRLRARVTGHIKDSQDLEKYLEIIEEVKPDIIHIHGTENSFGCIVSNTNIPVVLSVQGIISGIVNKFFNGFEKKYISYPDRKVQGLKSLLFPWSFKVEYDLYKQLKKSEVKYLKEFRFIMGRTNWDRRITSILSPNSTYFHEDRILRGSFYNAKWSRKNRNKIVLHTTNGNSYFKGFETICEAAMILKELNIDFEWRVAGINPDDLIVKLTKAKLNIDTIIEEVVFLGNIGESNLLESLLDSDIYIMTSHIENNANNLCEAMMLGIPCISSFAGGVGSLIKDGIDGVFFQDGDAMGLAGCILEVSNNNDIADQIGENARATSLIRHDKNRIVQDLVASYQ